MQAHGVFVIDSDVPTLQSNAASYGDIHPEVSRLQHLLRQREIQQTDFLEAFTGTYPVCQIIPFIE